MADRPTLSALRKLAREALGPGAEIVESCSAYQGDCYCEAESRTYSVKAGHPDGMQARRQLRQLLQSIIAGQDAGDGCTLHGDAPHGKEAEELRSGIEALMRLYLVLVPVDKLQRLLDRVNARDSLAHLMAKERQGRGRKR